MLITKEITIDLQYRKITETLEAVQCDANTRAAKVMLLNGGESWTPPVGAVASVAFKKPDGTAGWYDKLPDGSNACTVAGNAVTAIFAPQMLTAAGKVKAAVVFQDAKLNQLATFVFTVNVEANPAAGKGISNDYYNYTTMKEVNEAVNAALASLEEEKQDFLAKAEEALAAVHGAATEDAPAIVCEESGCVISVSDASDRLLQGLTLYGKTTQKGTPSPSSPVELVSVGASGTINATVCGGNLCNPHGFSLTHYYTVDEDGFVYFQNNTAYNNHPLLNCVLPKGDYTLTIDIIPITNNGVVYVGKNGSVDYTKKYGSSAVLSFSDIERITLVLAGKDGASVKARFTINAGSAALPYEPYKESQTLTASTPNGLAGIPVSSGGNYTDESGQAWICNEIDFVRGVCIQRTYTETFVLSKFIKTQNTNTAKYYIAPKYAGKWSVAGLCSVLPQGKFVYGNSDSEHWYVDAGVYLFIAKDNVSAFEANESVTITYALATPIETPLSAEEMAVYYALHSNKLNSTAFNDAGAGMKLAYVADTKQYIDNKFGELAAALVHNT